MCALSNNMSKFISIVFLILCACAAGLNAQDFGIPQGTVGAPYFCACDFGLNAALQPLLTNQDGFTFSYEFTFGGGTLPPGLTVSKNAEISGTPTTPGDYNFTLTFTFHLIADGMDFGSSFPFSGYLIRVTGYNGPPISV